jgi:hypothetical protein
MVERTAHDRPRDLETMQRFLNMALISLLVGLQPSAASSRGLHYAAPVDWNTCAFDAQKAVARHHGLTDRTDGTLGSTIYGDPQMSQEADDAFDSCVKKQSGGGRPGAG